MMAMYATVRRHLIPPARNALPGTPLSCDDGNVCNGLETCDKAQGCQSGTPLVCDDGDLCNGSETCDATQGCLPGSPLVCTDGNVCNGDETCDPTSGCQAGISLSCSSGETCDPTKGCVTLFILNDLLPGLSNDVFSTFGELIVRFELDELIRENPVTIIAPNNEAFLKVRRLSTAVADDVMEDIIKYHIVGGVFATNALKECQMFETVLQGTFIKQTWTVQDNGVKQYFFNGVVAVGIDLISHGLTVLHEIDGVLEPPPSSGVIAAPPSCD